MLTRAIRTSAVLRRLLLLLTVLLATSAGLAASSDGAPDPGSAPAAERSR